jgi:hypothetical protein
MHFRGLFYRHVSHQFSSYFVGQGVADKLESAACHSAHIVLALIECSKHSNVDDSDQRVALLKRALAHLVHSATHAKNSLTPSLFVDTISNLWLVVGKLLAYPNSLAFLFNPLKTALSLAGATEGKSVRFNNNYSSNYSNVLRSS